MKQWHHPASAQIQSRFLDPAVNVIMERLKVELDERRAKINLLQDDLLSVKFTPDRLAELHDYLNCIYLNKAAILFSCYSFALDATFVKEKLYI